MKETSSTKAVGWAGRRKGIAVVLAAILSTALLLSGTYAWYTAITEVNKFSHEGAEKLALLHDDFDDVPGKGGVYTKEIYVENTGTSADIYVRIKLQEYMDLTSWAERELVASDWQTHLPGDNPWTSPILNPDLDGYHANFEWEMGGSAEYVPQIGEYGVHNNFVNPIEGDKISTPDTTGKVILMSEYMLKSDADKKAFIGWVYDADGWAYWSQPLKPESATGLLLKSVTAAERLDDLDYFYAINVIMEAVDKSDLAMWMVPSGAHDGYGKPSVNPGMDQALLATNNAIIMLGLISDTDLKISGFTIKENPDKMVYEAGESFNPDGMSIMVDFLEGPPVEVFSGFGISPYGPLTALGTNVITITYNKMSVTLEVEVIAAQTPSED